MIDYKKEQQQSDDNPELIDLSQLYERSKRNYLLIALCAFVAALASVAHLALTPASYVGSMSYTANLDTRDISKLTGTLPVNDFLNVQNEIVDKTNKIFISSLKGKTPQILVGKLNHIFHDTTFVVTQDQFFNDSKMVGGRITFETTAPDAIRNQLKEIFKSSRAYTLELVAHEVLLNLKSEMKVNEYKLKELKRSEQLFSDLLDATKIHPQFSTLYQHKLRKDEIERLSKRIALVKNISQEDIAEELDMVVFNMGAVDDLALSQKRYAICLIYVITGLCIGILIAAFRRTDADQRKA